MVKPAETTLYPPVKAHLETLGYAVKGEIGAADVVGVKPECDPVIVELKTGFSLTLLQQAVARQAVTDTVYVAVPRWSGKAGWRAFKGNIGLCRRLGLGVMSVAGDVVTVHVDPAPFQPRKSKVKRAALMKEFAAREGDTTAGGTRGQVVTSYRQDAQRCAAYLELNGATKGAVVAREAEVSRATRIMADNHYGWFERAGRGVFMLSDEGVTALNPQTEDG